MIASLAFVLSVLTVSPSALRQTPSSQIEVAGVTYVPPWDAFLAISYKNRALQPLPMSARSLLA